MARIAFLLDDTYEDAEFQDPYDQLRDRGHEALIVGLEAGKEVSGKRGNSTATVDKAASDVGIDDFDAIVIPGGYSPDKLRMDESVVNLVRQANEREMPIAAICHAGWLLAEADVLQGRTVTSWPSIRTDLRNAGAEVVDREVCEDGNFITSRNPDDIPAFIDAIAGRL